MGEASQARNTHSGERTAKELLRRLRSRIGDARVGLVGRLATLIADESVRYLSAHFEPGRHLDGTIVVFTDQHLFWQVTKQSEDGIVDLEVTVAPRGSLLHLSSSGHERVRRDPFGNSQHVEWPWPLPVKLVYRDLPSFVLPLNGQVWGPDAEGLPDFVQSLMKDLAR